MGTHLRALGENFPMNTTHDRVYMFFKNLCILVLWTKVASAFKGLMNIVPAWVHDNLDNNMEKY